MRSQIVHHDLLRSLNVPQTYVTIRGSSEPQKTASGGLKSGYVEQDKHVPCWLTSPPYQAMVDRFGEQIAARVTLVAMFAPGTRISEGQTVVHEGKAYPVLKVSTSVIGDSPISVVLGDVRPIPKG